MRIILITYGPSRSATTLLQSLRSEQLPQRIIKLRQFGSSYTARTKDIILNWGKAYHPETWTYRFDPSLVDINDPYCVADACSKLRFFEILSQNGGVRLPDYTSDATEVEEWLDNGHTVFARTLLRASGGRGIVQLDSNSVDIPDAPLYTKYVPKASEWRVHVMFGRPVFIQRKIARDPDAIDNWKIRSHDNGFFFQQEYDPQALNDDVVEQAVNAVPALNLDFGAVDVIWNEHRSEAYVLEVNTAPGLEGRTVNIYTQEILEHVRRLTA